ncbi:MAG: ABC transporter permease [Alphaproteobacteria bacterium]
MDDRTKERIRDGLPIFALLFIIGVIAIADPGFIRPATLLAVAADTVTLFLMASGATLVIMLGSIDLSVQAVASMTSCIVAVLLPDLGFAAIPIALFAGGTIGLVSGLSVNRLRIPSFIATLAVGGIATTVAFIVSDTQSVPISRETSQIYLWWAVGEWSIVENEIFVGIAALIGLSLILSLTRFGRLVRAIGAQERAVIASGVNVDRVKLWAFIVSGLMAGLAGVVMAARLGSGSPTLANEFLLPAIAAVIVGGTALTGGVGSIWKTFVGALIIAVVRIGMTFVGVTIFAQQIVFGVILVVAVAVTMDRAKVAVVK